MLVAYIIVVALGILFKIMHWPFASILLLVSIALPTLDILVQLIRKSEIKGGRTLVSLSVAGISFYILFKLQYWPGDLFIFLLAMALNVPFVIWCFVQGIRKMTTLRISIWVLCLGFAIWLVTLNRLETRLTFMTEDPENPNEMMPVWIRYEVAFLYNQEGEYEKAENILEAALEDQQRWLEEGTPEEKRFAEKNIELLNSDLEKARKHEWTTYQLLYY